MRFIVGILSVLGIGAHGVFLFVCFAASGLSDAPQQSNSAWMPLLLPIIYYGYCLVSSIWSFRGPPLLFTGIVAHLIVVPFCFLAVQEGIGILVVGPLILAPCWFGMYSERKKRTQ